MFFTHIPGQENAAKFIFYDGNGQNVFNWSTPDDPNELQRVLQFDSKSRLYVIVPGWYLRFSKNGFLAHVLRKILNNLKMKRLTLKYKMWFVIVDWHKRAFVTPASRVAANTKVVAWELLRMVEG